MFHWESQSTTTASSPTGQRYIHHEARGSRVLLFVREQRKKDGRPGAPTEPFVCLGFARYEGHEGKRPMAWGNLCGDWSGGVPRQPPWPIRGNQVGRSESLIAPRLSPATTWGRRHENWATLLPEV